MAKGSGLPSQSAAADEDAPAKITLPAELKKRLVDDHDKIKAKKLAKLPARPTVSDVLNDFLKSYKTDSPEKEVACEVVAGVKVYFQHCLPAILLYKFEKQQYDNFNSADDEADPCTHYGGIHLLRLFVKLPGLLAKTQLKEDARSVLNAGLMQIITHIAKHADKLVPMRYADAGTEYKKRN
ncbi:hypothetical protein PTSG_04147 [Salpingoeca rosetta]|uniref:MRG domain-containing protein n=1 Tax=Salpingoeca rosetta (strain ATCC 50818 / BSB-021) TaxID=946362 RepID=F2U6R0_SALR5|nr:uncharacterized protein PTSG_04147 [Salpingoeca rosetta]EGD83542.1 hypothetical protein PTSG_04147 [Salpingoeca rosetta]|eukprot:XP_004995046.1 hypothetical protein PTSG_04147 [Salpingoeca rosetta]